MNVNNNANKTILLNLKMTILPVINYTTHRKFNRDDVFQVRLVLGEPQLICDGRNHTGIVITSFSDINDCALVVYSDENTNNSEPFELIFIELKDRHHRTLAIFTLSES